MNDTRAGFSGLKVIFLQCIPTDGLDWRRGPKPSEMFTLHIDFSLETSCGTTIAGQLLHEILRPSAGPEKFSPLDPLAKALFMFPMMSASGINQPQGPRDYQFKS